MKLYRIDVHEQQTRDGLATWLVSGESLTIHGEPMVKLSHGTIVPADGFFPTMAEATQEAARQIEVKGHRLLAQASKLRAEAAQMEAAR